MTHGNFIVMRTSFDRGADLRSCFGRPRSTVRHAQFSRVGILILVLTGAPVTALADFFGTYFANQLESAPVAEHGPIDVDIGGDSFSLNTVPLPLVDPTLGTGLALVGLATFRVDRNDVVSPRSTVAVTYARTNYENEVFGTGGKLFFHEDRFRVDFLAGQRI